MAEESRHTYHTALPAEPAIDAVLLDLGLPDSSGLDRLRALRGVNPSAAVIVSA